MPNAAPPPLRVRAVAVVTPWADAFGTVELACLPEGLELRAVSLARVDPEWAPAPELVGTRVVIPYVEILELSRDGALLRLGIGVHGFPFRRLSLARLSTDRGDRLEAALGQRRRVREGGLGAAAVVVLPALVWARVVGLPWSLAALTAALAAWSVIEIAAALARRVAFAAAAHEDVREALLAELVAHGARLVGPSPVPRPPPREVAAPEVPVPDARPWLATAIGLVVALTLFVAGARLLLAPMERPAAPAQVIASAEPAPPPPPAPAAAPAPCACARADSAAWRDGVRQLELRVGPREGSRVRAGMVDVDVVAVNAGDAPLRDVKVTAAVFGLAASGARAPRSVRTLFWEGTIAPGDAVRWRVEAEGAQVEPRSELVQRVGEGPLGPAPADALARLLRARARPARIEAARLLAFLRDPRAAAAVAALRAEGRDDEAAELAALARAAAPVVLCDVALTPGAVMRVSACADRAEGAAAGGWLARAVVGRAEAPASLTAPLPELPAGGTRVSFELPGPVTQNGPLDWGVERAVE